MAFEWETQKERDARYRNSIHAGLAVLIGILTVVVLAHLLAVLS